MAVPAVLLEPAGVVTTTSTVWAANVEENGTTTITDVGLTEKGTAVDEPKATEVVPLRFVPVIVIAFPPPTGPEAGVRRVTTGRPVVV